MSLRTYPDVAQGTDEWSDLRRGIVTASTVGQLVTPSTLKVANNDKSRAIVHELVAERLTGWTEPSYMSGDMLRGIEDEPIARAAYAEDRGVEVKEVGFMVREWEWGRLGFSPDGLVGDVGCLEIKSRQPKKQLQVVLAGEVPPENVLQCQAGLLVSGRAWLDFVSFCGGMPLFVHRVYPDAEIHDAIKAAVASFELAAADMEARYREAVRGMPATERMADEVVI